MTDNLTAQQERAEDIAEIQSLIKDQLAYIAELKQKKAFRRSPTTEEEEFEQEDQNYELFQEERYLKELQAELKLLQTEPIVEERRTRNIAGPANGLAVVIGHSVKGEDPGATGDGFPGTVTGDMRKEVHWNTELAKQIKAYADQRQIACEVFTRDFKDYSTGVTAAYKKVKAWGPQATFELHFNSFDGTACGTETLYFYNACKTWAQAVQDAMLNVFTPAAQAKGIQRRRGVWPNRKIKKRTTGRGILSIKILDPQTHGPSALLEPFFGDNSTDATVAQENKAAYARALVDAYITHFNVEAKPATQVISQAGGNTNGRQQQPETQTAIASAIPTEKYRLFSNQLWELFQAYCKTEIEFPQLRGISFAQWINEAGWQTEKDLPRIYKNFAGMKYREEMAPFSKPVSYTDWQGKTDDYCHFNSYEDFVKAYWLRLDLVSNYNGWRNHTATPEAFINFIGPIWAPASDNNVNYEKNVLGVMNRLKNDGYLPPLTNDLAKLNQQKTEEIPKNENGGTVPPGPIITNPQPEQKTPNATVTALSGTIKTTLDQCNKAKEDTTIPPNVATAINGVIMAGSRFLTEVKTSTTPAAPPSLVDIARKLEPQTSVVLLQAANLLEQAPRPDTRALKRAILSHWALESNWGRSELAQIHYNLAGLEWDGRFDDTAGRVAYKDKGFYCRFDDLQKFLSTYLKRLDNEQLAGWASKTTANEFIAQIAPVLRPSDATFASNVSKIAKAVEQLDAPGALLPSPIPSQPTPTVPDPQTGVTTPNGQDASFVIEVTRDEIETNSRGRQRTVGTYRALLDGQPIPGLEGEVFERPGPGNNTQTGINRRARIEAGTYPLWTHAGAKGDSGRTKYVTHGYTTSTAAFAESRPSLKVGSTNKRTGILLHPAQGFLNSIGCLNPSKPIAKAGPIGWSDSRKRMIALIDKLKEVRGDKFPKANNKRIPNAWLVVKGEPRATRSLLDARSRSTGSPTEAVRRISDQMLERLRPVELFDLMADAINGQVLPSLVDRSLFERALEAGGYLPKKSFFGTLLGAAKKLTGLRGSDGETLWEAWAQGWQASTEVSDPDERVRIQSDLNAIAQRMSGLGLHVNTPGTFDTPLTWAARNNAVEAMKKLLGFGAAINGYNPMGYTPLIVAAFNAAREAVTTLRENNADPALRSLSVEDVAQRRSRSLSVAPEDLEVFGETPPPGVTALEAAKVGKDMLGDPTDTIPIGGEIGPHKAYDDIITQLSR